MALSLCPLACIFVCHNFSFFFCFFFCCCWRFSSLSFCVRQGRVCSWSYNSRIRNATLLFAVVAALEARSGPMRDVIRKHFRLMKVGKERTRRACSVRFRSCSVRFGSVRFSLVPKGSVPFRTGGWPGGRLVNGRMQSMNRWMDGGEIIYQVRSRYCCRFLRTNRSGRLL